jgi:hypothetical protein
MQGKFKKKLEMKRSRFLVMQKFWTQEITEMIGMCLQKKGKNKSAKNLLSKLNNIGVLTRDNILKEYLHKCELKHAIMFFNWRKYHLQVGRGV